MITAAQLALENTKASTANGRNSHDTFRAMMHRDHIIKDHSRKVFIIFMSLFSYSLVAYMLSKVFLYL